MRVVVIGATGHIGSYLVPRLVNGGHAVVAISRGRRAPYLPDAAWSRVEQRVLDREAEEGKGEFGRQIAALEPDVVVDLICFRPESARHLVDALAGQIQHFLHSGTLWVHGASEAVPTDETAARRPFGEYGTRKAAIEEFLLRAARRDGFPATVLHPGHIVGPGWRPINPAGNLNPAVFEQLAHGRPTTLPDRGLATLHHVHADDVAQAFERAVRFRGCAVGESFHVASPAAVTLLGYAPRYTSARAVHEALRWLARHGDLDLPELDGSVRNRREPGGGDLV